MAGYSLIHLFFKGFLRKALCGEVEIMEVENMAAKLWEMVRATEELAYTKALTEKARTKYLIQLEKFKEAFYKIINEDG